MIVYIVFILLVFSIGASSVVQDLEFNITEGVVKSSPFMESPVDQEQQSEEYINGHTTYGFGLWCQLHFSNQSDFDSDEVRFISGVNAMENQKDMTKGTLAVYFQNRSIVFSALNTATQTISQQSVPINMYEVQNHWTFIYLASSGGGNSRKAVGYIRFTATNSQIFKKILIVNIRQQPLYNYLRFVLGKTGTYQGIDGYFYGVKLFFGLSTFFEDEGKLHQLTIFGFSIPPIDPEKEINKKEDL